MPEPVAPQKPDAPEVDTPAAAAPAPRRRRRRVRSLRGRLVGWTILTVMISTLMAVLAMDYLAYELTARQHRQATEQLTNLVAGALQGRLYRGSRSDTRAIIDRLREDPRIVLIDVTDASGDTRYRPVADADALAALEGYEPTRPGTLNLGGLTDPLTVCRAPILGPDTGEAPPQIEGYLALALRDRDTPEMLLWLTVFQLAAVGAVCLTVVPVSVYRIVKWTAPLGLLRNAVELLASGTRPPKIYTRSNDDLGRLCEAFNAMVHELYAAHEQLGGANKRLENIVKQRTAELRQLNGKLEVEATDKNEFLRAVSHDLNAPLRNIAGMAQMMLMKYRAELADDAVSKLERINANAKHQTELIADLMELSRLRTKETKPGVFDLGELIRKITDNLAFDLEKAGIELTLHGDFPEVYAERNRLRQVFQNLIDNAIKYMMDSPTRTITVSAQRTRDYKPDIFHGVDVWQFCVADSGRGIAEQDHEKVFQVFARSTHSGTHEVAGKGVGLASVKTIIEQYGGRIWLDSALGEGTSFTFTLPVENVTPPAGSLSGTADTADSADDADNGDNGDNGDGLHTPNNHQAA